MIKVTMQHPAIGAVELEFDSFAELFEKSSLLSQLPERCDRCGADVSLLYRNATAKQGPRAGTRMKYYGLQCKGPIRHEYYLGIHNDDSREIFVYGDRKFVDPYTPEQLADAESKPKCPTCGTTNQFHAKTCPQFTETGQEARTVEESPKVADSPPNAVSASSGAPGAVSGASAPPPQAPPAAVQHFTTITPPARTPLQEARGRFIAAVGALGLPTNNMMQLTLLLKSMLGVDTVPSPLTVDHWEQCTALLTQYKTAAEIGGITLDEQTVDAMLQRPASEASAADWTAAAERAMEG